MRRWGFLKRFSVGFVPLARTWTTGEEAVRPSGERAAVPGAPRMRMSAQVLAGLEEARRRHELAPRRALLQAVAERVLAAPDVEVELVPALKLVEAAGRSHMTATVQALYARLLALAGARADARQWVHAAALAALQEDSVNGRLVLDAFHRALAEDPAAAAYAPVYAPALAVLRNSGDFAGVLRLHAEMEAVPQLHGMRVGADSSKLVALMESGRARDAREMLCRPGIGHSVFVSKLNAYFASVRRLKGPHAMLQGKCSEIMDILDSVAIANIFTYTVFISAALVADPPAAARYADMLLRSSHALDDMAYEKVVQVAIMLKDAALAVRVRDHALAHSRQLPKRAVEALSEAALSTPALAVVLPQLEVPSSSDLLVREIRRTGKPFVTVSDFAANLRVSDLMRFCSEAGNISAFEASLTMKVARVSFWTLEEALVAVQLLNGASLGGSNVTVKLRPAWDLLDEPVSTWQRDRRRR